MGWVRRRERKEVVHCSNLCKMSYTEKVQTTFAAHAFLAIKMRSQQMAQMRMLHDAQLTSSALNAVVPLSLQA